jgi:hypothetical protein
MIILAGTFHFQPSEIKDLTLEEFLDWLEGADEINRSNSSGHDL